MKRSKPKLKELKKSHDNLEKTVERRTRELSLANRELKNLIEISQNTSEELQQSQIFLDSVIENIPNMIFVKDAKDLRFVRFNRAGEELLGYSRTELIGKNDYDFFSKEQADFFTEKDRAVLKGCKMVDIPEESINTKTGIRYLHTKKIPLLDQDGKAQYLLGISEDITEKKIAEEHKLKLIEEKIARSEAEKSAAQLRFLSQASGALSESLDILGMLNSFAKTVVANMADWCVVDLVSEQEKSAEHVIIAHKNPNLVEKAEEWKQKFPIDINAEYGVGLVIRTGKPQLNSNIDPEMLQWLVKDPEAYEIIRVLGIKSSIVVPLIMYGKVIGALTLVSAESGRSYSELDLSIALDLAKRLSVAIENARLFGKAQEASRAKSAFLANVSHEIRTPLGAMLGFAELLAEDKNLASQQLQYIDTIIKNGRQLLRIVDEILDLSKVESEAILIENIKFSLRRLVDEIAVLFDVQIRSKGLYFRTHYEENLPDRMISDPTRLRQIISNVVANAIKFTNKGGIDLYINIEPMQNNSEKGVLQITVKDTGIGIAKDQQKKLFRPFAQADYSITRKYGGTGLGLFLSRKLARLLGGDLFLEQSSADGGSAFIIRVEITYLKEEVEEKAIPTMDYSSMDPRKNHGAHVLVVDDSADNRALISLYLSRMGFKVSVAENGQQGAQEALSHPYDIVLMDIQMPGMDGFEAVRTLRAKDYHGVIIALTAHAMKGDRERCLDRGFDDYICKPVSKGSLTQLLLKHLGTH